MEKDILNIAYMLSIMFGSFCVGYAVGTCGHANYGGGASRPVEANMKSKWWSTLAIFLTIFFGSLLGVAIMMYWISDKSDIEVSSSGKLQPKREVVRITVAVSVPADYHRFFNAIRKVETGGEKDPYNADSKVDGKVFAIGPYQISEGYYKDSNVEFVTWQNCREIKCAEGVMLAYFYRFASRDLENGNWEKLARIHNGGPGGHLKPATEAYWQKVKTAMK